MPRLRPARSWSCSEPDIDVFLGLVRLSWRTGATFVHDWFALGVGLLVLGHIYFAIKDAEARRGMRTGHVSVDWAEREHAEWAEDELKSQR